MADATWKAVERSIARRLHGSRVGNRGANTPDVVNRWLSVEVKTRETLPQWLLVAMQQAVANAAPETLPVLMLHQTGQRHDNDLVCLRLADFEAWFIDVDTGRTAMLEGA